MGKGEEGEEDGSFEKDGAVFFACQLCCWLKSSN
jgi:hypothetical protein